MKKRIHRHNIYITDANLNLYTDNWVDSWMPQKSCTSYSNYDWIISVSRAHYNTGDHSIFILKYGNSIGYMLWSNEHFKYSTTTAINKYATSAVVTQL